jgi:uncharacterized delta-60 repeat protein
VRLTRRALWLLPAAACLLAVAGLAFGAAGALDPSFAGTGTKLVEVSGDSAYAVALQPDGKILLAGAVNANFDAVVYRLDAVGTFDPGFAGNGKRTIDSGGYEIADALAVQPDGKIVVAGTTSVGPAAAVYRLDSSGSLDPSFDGDGALGINVAGANGASAVAVQPDGKIVVAGSTVSGNGFVSRLNANGSFDTNFAIGGTQIIDSGGTEQLHAMALQPDGKIVVAGSTTVNSNAAVYRLNADGTFDAGFDGDGAVGIDSGGNEQANAVALQADGKIVVVGSTSVGAQVAVYRLNANGSMDASFDGDGALGIGTGYGSGAAVQPDGKLIVASSSTVYRLNSNGSFDTSFDGDGAASVGLSSGGVNAMARQPDGKIVLAGGTLVGGTVTAFAARLLGDPHTVTVVRSGTGSGSVESAPDGIACGATCTHLFDGSAPVALTATASAGSTFTGWSGGGCSGTAVCRPSLGADVIVTATFKADTTTTPPPPKAPVARLTAHPTTLVKTARKAIRATFKFAADQAGSTFRCALDGKPFTACKSPARFTVKPGTHRFRVEATKGGTVGPVVFFRFKVVRRR